MTTALAVRPAAAPAAPRELTPAPADQHPAAVYLARLAEGSRRTMRQALDICAGIITNGRDDARTIRWQDVRYQHSQLIRSELAQRYAPATANKMLAALRGVLREAWRLGLVPAEDYHRAADLSGIRGTRPLRGRALSAGELAALFGACARDKRPNGRRDAALLALCYGAGIRRSEATGVDVDHYNSTTGALRIRGKGNKVRDVFLPASAQQAVAAWLEVRGHDDGPLFSAVDQAGRVRPGRITPQVVAQALAKRAREAALSQSCSPHDLRRTFVSDLLDLGADLATVQKMAGHANVQTTARYDRRGEVAQQQAAHRLHVPYIAASA
jgi:site-specific recombinase XerD